MSSRWTRFLWLGEALGISSLAADVENKKAREITGFDEENLRVLVAVYSHSIVNKNNRLVFSAFECIALAYPEQRWKVHIPSKVPSLVFRWINLSGLYQLG